MKVVHLNQPKIRHQQEIKALAETFKLKGERNARDWVKKKYAALKQERHSS